MHNSTPSSNSTLMIIRWTARILGALIIAIFLFFFIGESLGSGPESQPLSTNAIVQLIFMGIELLGLAVAWKWELIGGCTTLVGFIAKGILNPKTIAFPLLLSPGTALLFLLCWWLSKKPSIERPGATT